MCNRGYRERCRILPTLTKHCVCLYIVLRQTRAVRHWTCVMRGIVMIGGRWSEGGNSLKWVAAAAFSRWPLLTGNFSGKWSVNRNMAAHSRWPLMPGAVHCRYYCTCNFNSSVVPSSTTLFTLTPSTFQTNHDAFMSVSCQTPSYVHLYNKSKVIDIYI